LPYKTEFDCSAPAGGHCGSLTQNIREAYALAGIGDVPNTQKHDINYEINKITLDRKKMNTNQGYNYPKTDTGREIE